MKEQNKKHLISRKKRLAEKVIFVDGLPGCGKTLLSSIVASLDKVELLSYSYEIEHYCSLHYLNKLKPDAAKSLIRMQVDLKLYNTMMGREVNFRPADLSSVFMSQDPNKYLKRIFLDGDAKVLDQIYAQNPILNIAVHNLLAYSEPIWDALGERAVFIEVVRHPLYMIRQQALNFENLLENVRDFSVYFSYKGRELPYYINGWEDLYLESSAIERSVHLMDNYLSIVEKAKEKIISDYQAKILTVPFELFVLDPNPWIERISDITGAGINEVTRRVMEEQNIPRKKVAEGIDLEVYRRCGWVPPSEGMSEKDELLIRRREVEISTSSKVMNVLDKICGEYENLYWNP